MKILQKTYHYLQLLRKKPWVAQALWVIPVFGLLKNLIDTLIIGKDVVSQRKFGVKEKFFKTLSALFSLCFWRVILVSYSNNNHFNTYLLIWVTTALQAGNRWCYVLGVYFSGELQKILQMNTTHIKSNTIKAIQWANKILSTTKKGAQTLWNTIKKIKINK